MRWTISSILTSVFFMLTSPALASDGVREINQTCAIQGGCFPGDTPGFPVQITTRGSYVLTSNLTQLNPNVSVVQILTSSISLDLNGFAIQGSNTFFGTSCSAPGGGAGIVSVANTDDIAISNGAIRGMGSSGIALGQTLMARVDHVSAEHNCGDGISVWYLSLVTNSSAHYNAFTGFRLLATSRLSNCSALVNGQVGIYAPESAVNIDRCVVTNNSGSGILVDGAGTHFGTLIRDSRILSNGLNGISLGSGVVDNGSLILRSSVIQNAGSSIPQVPFGAVTLEGNGGGDNPGSIAALSCYVAGTARLCP